MIPAQFSGSGRLGCTLSHGLRQPGLKICAGRLPADRILLSLLLLNKLQMLFINHTSLLVNFQKFVVEVFLSEGHVGG